MILLNLGRFLVDLVIFVKLIYLGLFCSILESFGQFCPVSILSFDFFPSTYVNFALSSSIFAFMIDYDRFLSISSIMFPLNIIFLAISLSRFRSIFDVNDFIGRTLKSY